MLLVHFVSFKTKRISGNQIQIKGLHFPNIVPLSRSFFKDIEKHRLVKLQVLCFDFSNWIDILGHPKMESKINKIGGGNVLTYTFKRS